VVKVLLETGKANVEAKDDRYGQTLLSWAAEKGHEAGGQAVTGQDLSRLLVDLIVCLLSSFIY
jgi:hypothetical protein